MIPSDAKTLRAGIQSGTLPARRNLLVRQPTSATSSYFFMPTRETTTSTPVSLGRYQINGVLGKGAMGIVYAAFDPVIERTVAVKTIDLSFEAEEVQPFIERFYREAKAAGGLNHPNIVTIYDVAESNEKAYIAMELLEGLSLRQIIDVGSRLSATRTARIVADVADALAYAHDHGVIHRDVKPANIVLTKGGLTKITDFGIAQLPATSSTQPGLLIGSPRYMSPEQLAGVPLDGRSDIFSLGAVLYELLTGQAPFHGKDLRELMYCIFHKEPLPLSRLVTRLPTSLDAVVARALAKKPADRFQNARDLARALRAFQATPNAALDHQATTTTPPPDAEKMVSTIILPKASSARGLKLMNPSHAKPRRRKRFGFVAVSITTIGALTPIAINQLTAQPIEPSPTHLQIAPPPPSARNLEPSATVVQLAASSIPAKITVIEPPRQEKTQKPKPIKGGNNSLVNELDERLKKLRRELDELKAKFTDHHPDVATKKRHIEELEKQRAEIERG
jgi:eukaryotic-like serine/threonine-protein kinase